MRLSWARNSILVRMLLISLLAVLPLYVIGVSLYAAGSEQLISETMSAKESQMEYYVESMQRELVRLTLLQSALVNNAEIGTVVNRSQYLSSYEWGRRVNDLRNDLISIRYSSQYAETVTAYLRPMGRMLNDLKGLGVLNEADVALARALGESRANLVCVQGDLYIVASLRDSANQPVYTVATKILGSALTEDLVRLGTQVPSESALVYLPERVAVASSSERADALWRTASERDEEGAHPVSATRSRQVLDGEACRVISVQATSLRLALYNITREKDLRAVAGRYTPYLLAFALATGLLLAVMLPSLSSMVHRPLHRLMNAFERVEGGDMRVSITHHRRDEFEQLYQGFNHMVRTLDRTINQSLQQELLLKKAELMQLQSQINPHFLYNSYFLLHRMIKRHDWENAELFSRHMGGYFQYITRGERQVVPLEQEAGHARLYAQIQAMRFGARIRVDFGQLPEECEGLQVPRLILQPVLENTFEHGLREKVEDGWVRVGFSKEGSGCVVVVEDNGEDLDEEGLRALSALLKEDGGEITALRNIHRRLTGGMPEGSGLRLSRSVLGGLRVEIHLTGGATDESVDR